MPPRRLGFVVYPRMTLLDFVGPYDALRRVRTMHVDDRLDWTIIGTTDPVADETGLRVAVDAVMPALADFDLLVVPGGHGADTLAVDERFVTWLRTWPRDRAIASVCSGALLLGAAGFLTGRRATTHHTRLDALRPFCGEVVAGQRVVEDTASSELFTSGGVTAGIDLGLHLVGHYWGTDARARIAAQMEWPGSSPDPRSR